jgi:nitrite reductase (NAD(P)H)
MKLDTRTREYDIIVLGEEPHLAYNRVGLTSFFDHRKIENLYLNSEDWVRSMATTIVEKHLLNFFFLWNSTRAPPRAPWDTT